MKPEKPYYVILTGSKNNAGDYLIKYRAKNLFKSAREDRQVVDIDGWKPLNGDTLELVNGSKALILMGGPALQKNMYPSIYPLTEDISDIQVPITTMGIGWKSLRGEWSDTRNYPINAGTAQLLSRIKDDGLKASVRDYHTLNILQANSVENAVMTGCPATYIPEMIGSEIRKPEQIRKVGFSLGVSFLQSKSLETQMKGLILRLKDYFKDAIFEVVFHHSLKNDFLSTHNATESHLKGHLTFAKWLEEVGVSYVDISGSAENLINYYDSCDLHIGYRVHAHIFMNSVSKPSVLIAEDGRGKALTSVFGGIVVNAFDEVGDSLISKILRKLALTDTFNVYSSFDQEFINILDYEITNDYPRVRASRRTIDSNYKLMYSFLKSLP